MTSSKTGKAMEKPKKTITQKGPDILIVEDSPTQALAMKFLLEKHGYQVREAANGRKALDEVYKHKPTLIISDIMMPVMDGYELCRTIKGDATLRDIPVILLTTLSSAEDIVRGLDAGTHYYITKPYDESFLLSTIKSLLTSSVEREDEEEGSGIEIDFAGKRHVITAGRRQILNLLLSTYENAVLQNQELMRMQEELREAYDELKRSNSELLQLIMELEDRLADSRDYPSRPSQI